MNYDSDFGLNETFLTCRQLSRLWARLRRVLGPPLSVAAGGWTLRSAKLMESRPLKANFGRGLRVSQAFRQTNLISLLRR